MVGDQNERSARDPLATLSLAAPVWAQDPPVDPAPPIPQRGGFQAMTPEARRPASCAAGRASAAGAPDPDAPRLEERLTSPMAGSKGGPAA